MINYPDSFFRGITSAAMKDGYLLPESFQLDGGRDDQFEEISITWNDDEKAFVVIASQINERSGEIQFSSGISKIERLNFESKMKPQIIAQNISYERRPTYNNRYHGNLLVKKELPRHIKNMIKSQLALIAQDCILNNPYV